MARTDPGVPQEVRGSSLLEVLVAVFVLGVGLVGMAAAQTIAHVTVRDLETQAVALMDFASAWEGLRLGNAAGGGVSTGPGWSCRWAGDGHDPVALPAGQAPAPGQVCHQVQCTAAQCRVQVRWGGSLRVGMDGLVQSGWP